MDDVVEQTPEELLAQAAVAARTLLGYSLKGAAEGLEIEESILSNIEHGTMPLNGEMREAMESFYDVDLDRFISNKAEYVPRVVPEYDEDRGLVVLGSMGVRFRVGVDENDALLRGYSAAVRRLRGLAPSVPLQIRHADVPILAGLLDLSDPELEDRARFWFGQSEEAAHGLVAHLRLMRGAEAIRRAQASA
ncbi:MAG: helix-turn-helix transcriptional regulator [Acidimicrobiales bacterium]|nr:helix-turn-helix transcriptional regulator [Acidimicrobiales bacterium]RZV47091.1 MAG: XRE family transcriptional regulator [Acidimicrobiales bacterium]